MMGSRLKAEGLSLLSIGHAVVTVMPLECSVGATAQWCPTFQASVVRQHNFIFLCLHLFSIVQDELQPTVPHVIACVNDAFCQTSPFMVYVAITLQSLRPRTGTKSITKNSQLTAQK